MQLEVYKFQARLSTFFENLGWKVYRVPETANILLSGGVNFSDLSPEAAEKFQVKFFVLDYLTTMVLASLRFEAYKNMARGDAHTCKLYPVLT